MRYVEARLDEYNREEAYRIYVTKSLQLVPQSKFLQIPYTDLLNSNKVNDKSGGEIALNIFEKAGLKFEG